MQNDYTAKLETQKASIGIPTAGTVTPRGLVMESGMVGRPIGVDGLGTRMPEVQIRDFTPNTVRATTGQIGNVNNALREGSLKGFEGTMKPNFSRSPRATSINQPEFAKSYTDNQPSGSKASIDADRVALNPILRDNPRPVVSSDSQPNLLGFLANLKWPWNSSERVPFAKAMTATDSLQSSVSQLIQSATEGRTGQVAGKSYRVYLCAPFTWYGQVFPFDAVVQQVNTPGKRYLNEQQAPCYEPYVRLVYFNGANRWAYSGDGGSKGYFGFSEFLPADGQGMTGTPCAIGTPFFYYERVDGTSVDADKQADPGYKAQQTGNNDIVLPAKTTPDTIPQNNPIYPDANNNQQAATDKAFNAPAIAESPIGNFPNPLNFNDQLQQFISDKLADTFNNAFNPIQDSNLNPSNLISDFIAKFPQYNPSDFLNNFPIATDNQNYSIDSLPRFKVYENPTQIPIQAPIENSTISQKTGKENSIDPFKYDPSHDPFRYDATKDPFANPYGGIDPFKNDPSHDPFRSEPSTNPLYQDFNNQNPTNQPTSNPQNNPSYNPNTNPIPNPIQTEVTQPQPNPEPNPSQNENPNNPNPTPSDNPCESPCFQELSQNVRDIKENQTQSNQPELTTITVKIFTYCGIDSMGKITPESEDLSLQVPKGLEQAAQAFYTAKFEADSAQCYDTKLGIPEDWKHRITGNRPQLIVVFREIQGGRLLNSNTRTLAIPHFFPNAGNKIIIPDYFTGDWQVSLTLKDGSILKGYFKGEYEGKAFINSLKKYVDKTQVDKTRKPLALDTEKGIANKQYRAVLCHFYREGKIKGATPDWSSKLWTKA